MAANKAKPVKQDGITTEFLIQTLASIQSALSSIDKESSAKTEALGAVLENINGMADMMKHFHDVNTADSAKIVELGSVIKTLQAHLAGADTDLKEIKYSIQKLSDNLIELKTIKQTREELKEEIKADKKNEEPKKFSFFAFIKKFVEILSNLKTILIVALIIILLVASLFYGPSVIQIFLEIFKVTNGS